MIKISEYLLVIKKISGTPVCYDKNTGISVGYKKIPVHLSVMVKIPVYILAAIKIPEIWWITGGLGGETVDKNIRIKVIDSETGKEIIISPNPGENLYDALIRFGTLIPGECGGKGTCGKCAVMITDGIPGITESDRKILSGDKLTLGFRLACMACPDRDCTVVLPKGTGTGFKVVAESLRYKELQDRDQLTDNTKEGYAIAIDLGTTTLAFVLIDLRGDILKKYTAINPQRAYGADVISRIKASNEGKGHILKFLIGNELILGIKTLAAEYKIDLTDIKRIAISGNTAMIHLLMGYPCEGLGVYPFTPYKKGFIYSYSDELFDISERIPVVILPSISGFVGGDISAGLLACGFDKTENPCLFIDLGTNGEMALGNRGRILVTSAPAGPAFEGGNISCGVGGIGGAICHVSSLKNKLKFETIDGLPPIGLCGTGVIELTACLLNEGIIDRTGLLSDKYFDKGFYIDGIRFLQADIRNVQLAKAAIRAGIEILLKNYGISYDRLDRVYVAGGFGYYLDISKAVDIGLLPPAVKDKAEAAGNTALSGAVLASVDSRTENRLERILSVANEIYLSDDREFNDLFVRYMSF